MQLPRSWHFGWDALFDDGTKRVVIRRVREFGPIEARPTPAAAGLTVAQSALGFEDLFSYGDVGGLGHRGASKHNHENSGPNSATLHLGPTRQFAPRRATTEGSGFI
jgi:hypothetical protein